MNRIEYRRFFQKTAAIFTLSSVFFMTIMSGLAVYITDWVSENEDEPGMYYYILFMLFIFGLFMIVFETMCGFVQFVKKSEGTDVMTRFSSILSMIISGLFIPTCLILLITDYSELRTYDTSQKEFMVAFIVMSIVAAFIILLFSFIARKSIKIGLLYADTEKHFALTVPEDVDYLRANYVYHSFMAVILAVYTACISFFMFYLRYECEDYASDYEVQTLMGEHLFLALFIVYALVSISLIVFSILVIKKIDFASKGIFGLSIFLIVLYILTGVLECSFIGSAAASKGYVDYTYMIFTAVMMVICLPMIIGCIVAFRPLKKLDPDADIEALL